MTYQDAIANAIGTDANDPIVAVIEEIMRNGRSGLDSLTPAQFSAEACEALETVREMAQAGELEFYCETLGLAMPALA